MENEVVDCFGDNQFTTTLAKYLNRKNIIQICQEYKKPPMNNNNINPRTGRIRIGIPSTRPRKILRLGSTKNYKSIILKFCKFKADCYGPDSDIAASMIEKYVDEKLNDGTKSYQTMVTEIRVLNKYVIVPTVGQEMPRPKPKLQLLRNSDLRNNKPQFTHGEIALSLIRLYNTCTNRDHVHKAYLIYYTGLRSAEAEALTFRDIAEGYSKELVVIPVRRGKGRQMRNVILFQGAPTYYYKRILLPYLALKMSRLLMNNLDKTAVDFYDEKIFGNSNYAACRKAYRKCLLWAIQKYKRVHEEEEEEGDGDEEEEEGDEDINGCGMHSIRTDYATRALKTVHAVTKHVILTIETVSKLLGHRNSKILMKHYLNKGCDFDVEKILKIYNENDVGDDKIIIGGVITDKQYSVAENPETLLFNGYKSGKTAKLLLKNRKKRKGADRRNKVDELMKVVDGNYIIPETPDDIRKGERRGGGGGDEEKDDDGAVRNCERENPSLLSSDDDDDDDGNFFLCTNNNNDVYRHSSDIGRFLVI